MQQTGVTEAKRSATTPENRSKGGGQENVRMEDEAHWRGLYST